MYYMGGNTNTAAAIAEMNNNMFTPNNGDRGNINNVGVVVTDGRLVKARVIKSKSKI